MTKVAVKPEDVQPGDLLLGALDRPTYVVVEVCSNGVFAENAETGLVKPFMCLDGETWLMSGSPTSRSRVAYRPNPWKSVGNCVDYDDDWCFTVNARHPTDNMPKLDAAAACDDTAAWMAEQLAEGRWQSRSSRRTRPTGSQG